MSPHKRVCWWADVYDRVNIRVLHLVTKPLSQAYVTQPTLST
jgi:hypothetical protein